jgi:hypothetical protein
MSLACLVGVKDVCCTRVMLMDYNCGTRPFIMALDSTRRELLDKVACI